MKHAFKSALIIAFVLISFSTYAQKHNMKPGWCKYAKKGKGTSRDESASAECKACAAETEKERKKIAKTFELNPERDELNKKANKLASEARLKETIKKSNERNKVTEVAVTMPKPLAPAPAIKKPVETKAPAAEKIIYMTASWGKVPFKNAMTEEDITTATELKFVAVEGTYMEDGTISRNNFPANLGVIQLEQQVKAPNHPYFEIHPNSASYKPYDLVDAQLKRVFNSDSISNIVHFYGNWFMVSSGFANFNWSTNSFGSVKLYNVKTKESVPIPEKSYRHAVEMATFNYHGLENRPVARNYRFFKGSYQGDGSDGKKVQERSPCETTFDNIIGGPDKWKAFVAVKPYKSKQDRDVQGYIYYCDANEKIVKVKVTIEDLRSLRG